MIEGQKKKGQEFKNGKRVSILGRIVLSELKLVVDSQKCLCVCLYVTVCVGGNTAVLPNLGNTDVTEALDRKQCCLSPFIDLITVI